MSTAVGKKSAAVGPVHHDPNAPVIDRDGRLRRLSELGDIMPVPTDTELTGVLAGVQRRLRGQGPAQRLPIGTAGHPRSPLWNCVSWCQKNPRLVAEGAEIQVGYTFWVFHFGPRLIQKGPGAVAGVVRRPDATGPGIMMTHLGRVARVEAHIHTVIRLPTPADAPVDAPPCFLDLTPDPTTDADELVFLPSNLPRRFVMEQLAAAVGTTPDHSRGRAAIRAGTGILLTDGGRNVMVPLFEADGALSAEETRRRLTRQWPVQTFDFDAASSILIHALSRHIAPDRFRVRRGRDLCEACGARTTNRCGGCGLAYFCSPACQKHTWTGPAAGGHRAICKNVQEITAIGLRNHQAHVRAETQRQKKAAKQAASRERRKRAKQAKHGKQTEDSEGAGDTPGPTDGGSETAVLPVREAVIQALAEQWGDQEDALVRAAEVTDAIDEIRAQLGPEEARKMLSDIIQQASSAGAAAPG